jgi:hypothetical protein
MGTVAKFTPANVYGGWDRNVAAKHALVSTWFG